MQQHPTQAHSAQQLHEQYRPRTWGDVIGQDKTLAKIERLRQRGHELARLDEIIGIAPYLPTATDGRTE